MTEKRVEITVSLRSPLLLGDESGADNYEQTTGYIPGSVLRGAVADRLLDALPANYPYIRDHPSCPEEEQPAFWRVFGAASPPRFDNAYPARPCRWAYPFPATARTCKRHPGYKADDNRRGHGVFDTLVEQAVYDLVSDPRFPYRAELTGLEEKEWATLPGAYDPCCHYPGCGGDTKPAEGCYLVEEDGPAPIPHLAVSRATHVGVNRARGVAEDALLFTLETIDQSSPEFRGQLIYDDTYEADLETALPLDGRASEYVIGRGRSRGMGLVEINAGPAPDLPELSDRLQELNRLFRDVLASYHAADPRVSPASSGRFFSLTLCAPAILTAADGTPALWPDLAPAGLEAAWRLRAWARTTLVGGWDAAAGLPRRTRQAVQAGAVYLYHVPEDVLPEKTLVGRLSALEWAGVGEQRERGYGQLIVCAPFHYAGYRG